jgi:hypothetical protein
MNVKKIFCAVALVVSGASASPEGASAANLIADQVRDSCTTLNCGAVVLNGITQGNVFADSIPFTSSFFANTGDCIRLDVTVADADLEIVLVSPNGTVFRNDDRPGSTRPLLIARAPKKGYYTAQINVFNGAQPANSLQTFTLAYGRYVEGTATNCPSVQTPVFAPVAAAKSTGAK